MPIVNKNVVIGIMDNFKYESASMILEVGDTLILYTDGVTEAFNEEKQQFTEANLEKTLNSVPGAGSQEIIEAIMEDVKDFTGNEPQSDDITVLTIKRLS